MNEDSSNEGAASDLNGKGDGVVRIKEEPMDPEFNSMESQDSVQKNGAYRRAASSEETNTKLREILKTMVADQNKELTLQNVVEDLLRKNDFLPPSNSNSGKQNQGDQLTDADSSTLLQQKSPTRSCSLPKDGLANVDEALVEEPVKTKSNMLDIVCSVGSKVVLTSSDGSMLETDIICYWCNFCSYRSDKKENLLEHVMEHRFHCKYCKYQSFSRADVVSHSTESHEEFAALSKTLQYCTFLPDYLQGDKQNQKRKRGGDETPNEKRRRSDSTNQMEVESPTQSRGATPTRGHAGKVKKMTARKSMPSPSNQVPMNVSTTPVKLVPGVGTSIPQFVPAVTTPMPTAPTPPVTPSVTSGHKPVSAAGAAASSATHTEPPKKASSVTVSSGLCWNCGYCGFVTLSQSFLKIHLNTHHTGKAHKYVAMLVSSEDEMNRIKQSDSLLITNPPASGAYSYSNTAAPTPQASPAVGGSNSQIEIDNAESDQSQGGINDDEASKIPQSFKCAHCNFSSPFSDKVKIHLLQRHMGSVMYALDMRAVKLKQRRYVFFCLKNRCGFSTKDMEDYQDHIDSCTPWLDGNGSLDVDALMVKSLELTRQFTSKVGSSNQGLGRDLKSDKAAEYGCVYCSYLSSNNTRLKKHVLANHKDRICIIKDLQATQKQRNQTVYFCRLCLWESRNGTELDIHMQERHNEMPDIQLSDVRVTSTVSTPIQHPQVRKISSKTPYSSQESSPAPSASPSEPDDDSQDDDDYNGLVSESDIDRAMSEFVADESSREKSSGRPSREAALKAHIKVRTAGKPPPLFRCVHCNELAYGIRLIRRHIRNHHAHMPLRAIDIKRKSKGALAFVYMCPNDTCTFSTNNADDVVKHAKKEHHLPETDADLTKIVNIFRSPLSSSPKANTAELLYECLFCTTSTVFSSIFEMKTHLIKMHPSEELVFRDVMARKKLKRSRMQLCPEIDCEHYVLEFDDLSLHRLAHSQSEIFQCTKCYWFTEDLDKVALHHKTVHDNKEVGVTKFKLDLDESGKVIKSKAPLNIKAEPE